MGIGSALAIGGSVASGIIGSKASGKAANAQVDAADRSAELQHQDAQEALRFQQRQWLESLRNMYPWLRTGSSAQVNLANLLGVLPGDNGGYGPSGTGMAIPSTGGSIVFDPSTGQYVPLRRGSASATAPVAGAGSGQPLSLSSLASPSGIKFSGGPTPAPEGVPALTGGPDGVMTPAPPADGSVPLSLLAGGGTAALAPITANGTGAVAAVDDTGSPMPVPGGAGAPPAGGSGGAGGTLADPFAGISLSSLVNPSLGAPGSLLQPWQGRFIAPDNVSEAEDPGFQFRLKQGQQALENSAAARGSLLSGGTAKALQRYGQDYASSEYDKVYSRALTEYQQSYNQFQQAQADRFNRLASLAGMGQVTAGQLTSAGQNAANNTGNILLTSGRNIGNDYIGAGNARASGYIGKANAFNNALSGALSLTSLLGNY